MARDDRTKEQAISGAPLTDIESESIVFEQPIKITKLPDQFATTFEAGDTTPDVQDTTKFQAANVIVSITNFLNGQEGQTIKILGDGVTTVIDGATLITNTAADKLLTGNRVFTFTLFNGVWIEDE